MAQLKIRLGRRSSIPQARWCVPIGWEPSNVIEGAEFVDGSWWGENEEEAGLVCFTQGDEGQEYCVALGDLRVASCGDCRVIGEVQLSDGQR